MRPNTVLPSCLAVDGLAVDAQFLDPSICPPISPHPYHQNQQAEITARARLLIPQRVRLECLISARADPSSRRRVRATVW